MSFMMVISLPELGHILARVQGLRMKTASKKRQLSCVAPEQPVVSPRNWGCPNPFERLTDGHGGPVVSPRNWGCPNFRTVRVVLNDLSSAPETGAAPIDGAGSSRHLAPVVSPRNWGCPNHRTPPQRRRTPVVSPRNWGCPNRSRRRPSPGLSSAPETGAAPIRGQPWPGLAPVVSPRNWGCPNTTTHAAGVA